MKRSLAVALLIAPSVSAGSDARAAALSADGHGSHRRAQRTTDALGCATLSSDAAAGRVEPSWVDASRYLRLVHETASRHGVDPDLVVAVIRVESEFNPRAVSPKGAEGLMQLMPTTARVLGVRNTFDPRQNVEGGVRHLRYLMDRYPGRPTLALAAYNAGEWAVNQHRGVPPYPETRHYVRRVLALRGQSAGLTDAPVPCPSTRSAALPAVSPASVSSRATS
jgi:soluble lytic murein transglycosylase-like protein